jgi:nitrogen regulatory protein PII
MKLVVLITAQTESGLEVAQAWQDAGAPGATIIRSHGLHRLQHEAQEAQIELPRMVVSMAAAMAHIIDNAEERSTLVLSLVDDEVVEKLVAATTGVLGDLTQPGHGVFFVINVEHAIGVRYYGKS